MSESGQPVSVSDVDPPRDPESELDALIDYIQGPYVESLERWREMVGEARQLKSRAAMIDLGYECIVFRSELDPWIALAIQLYDTERGKQLTITNDEAEKRPTGEYLKASTAVFVAPLKRAMKELEDTQDLLTKTLSWCQTQQKAIAADEYGELFSSSETVPERLYSSTPALGSALNRVKPK